MAKATRTIRQALRYQAAHRSSFAATKTLFNHATFTRTMDYVAVLEEAAGLEAVQSVTLVSR
jgi:hypothetical protein